MLSKAYKLCSKNEERAFPVEVHPSDYIFDGSEHRASVKGKLFLRPATEQEIQDWLIAKLRGEMEYHRQEQDENSLMNRSMRPGGYDPRNMRYEDELCVEVPRWMEDRINRVQEVKGEYFTANEWVIWGNPSPMRGLINFTHREDDTIFGYYVQAVLNISPYPEYVPKDNWNYWEG